jgi:hypothetical protein
VPKPPSSAGVPGRAPLAAFLAGVLAAPSPALADPPPAPAAPLAAAPANAPAAAAYWTRVHIVTQKPAVVLERREGSLPTDPPPLPKGIYSDSEPVWQVVCKSPCDTSVQLGGEYRIGGEGVTASSPFALHGPSTELRVDAGAHEIRRAGIYLAIIGFLAAAAGGVFLAVQAIRPPEGGGLGTGGYVAIGAAAAGGALGLTGVGLIVGGGTSVRDEARRDLARFAPPPTLHATFRF